MCVTSFGSEFKNIKELENFFKKHPRWHQLKQLLTYGVDFPVLELGDNEQQLDLHAAFDRGNHKSIKRKMKVLEREIMNEVEKVEKGWNIILPAATYGKIPGIVLNSIGVATHVGITSNGEFLEKDRLTHDLSFPDAFSGQTFNSRVNQGVLEPCMFSHVILHLIHYIVNLRRR